MQLFVELLIMAVLLALFVQDMRSRAVYWLLFPVLAVLLVSLYGLSGLRLVEWWPVVLTNLGFLLIQLLAVSAWFSLRQGAWVNITSNLLGWGDILFLACLGCYLSPLNFIAFFIVSLSLVLLLWALVKWLVVSYNPQVPLAGLQALIFAVVLLAKIVDSHIVLTSDQWLIQQLAL